MHIIHVFQKYGAFLLIYIVDAERVLLHVDAKGRTFLHYAARQKLSELTKVLPIIPKLILPKLLLVQDKDGKTARDVSKCLAATRCLDRAMLLEPYILKTAPKVLIFYSTKNRTESEMGDGKTYAEKERDCVKEYFASKNFPMVVKKDPTAAEIFSTISNAQDDENLSGLVVFVMCHGEKGLMTVEGEPDYLLMQELISHMCRQVDGKPKVRSHRSFVSSTKRRE